MNLSPYVCCLVYLYTVYVLPTVAKLACDTEDIILPYAAWISPFKPPEIISLSGRRVPIKPEVTIWTDGIVKYYVNSTLNSTELLELNSAIEEYHEKTCVRFELWTGNETENYVSIERDDTIDCGVSQVCMRGTGYQYARFTTECMNKATFVHELGHTLCLAHENQRQDRDKYLNFTGCNASDIPNKPKYNTDMGLYDYASQMHYGCERCHVGEPNYPSPSVCGDQAHSGLSVMDADAVNLIYKCGGCKRHRWVPFEMLNREYLRDEIKKQMHSFGELDTFGYEIFPCRALYEGMVSVGLYSFEHNICFISSRNGFWPADRRIDVEVLTIPDGLSANCSLTVGTKNNSTLCQYEIGTYLESEGTLLRKGIPAGSVILGDNMYFEGFIAFGKERANYYMNGSFQVVTNDVIGTAWKVNGKIGHLSYPFHGVENNRSSVKILVCNEYTV